jgi:hypothetical protein
MWQCHYKYDKCLCLCSPSSHHALWLVFFLMFLSFIPTTWHMSQTITMMKLLKSIHQVNVLTFIVLGINMVVMFHCFVLWGIKVILYGLEATCIFFLGRRRCWMGPYCPSRVSITFFTYKSIQIKTTNQYKIMKTTQNWILFYIFECVLMKTIFMGLDFKLLILFDDYHIRQKIIAHVPWTIRLNPKY